MLFELGILLVSHVIFDFLLQSRTTAKNKSSNIKYLFGHLFTIMFGIMLTGLFFKSMSQTNLFLFALSNTIVHGIIDWNIWNLYKYSVVKRFPEVADGKIKFEYWEDSWFYNFIALDQLLHGLCYLITYFLFKGG